MKRSGILMILLMTTVSVVFAQTTPTTPEGWLALGLQQHAKKDYDGAVRSFTECIKLKPDATGCYTNRGNDYYQQENFDLAVADTTKSIQLRPSREAFLLRSWVYCDQDKFNLAAADEAKVVELGGKVDNPCFGLPVAKTGEADFNHHPTAFLYYQKGLRDSVDGRFDSAIANFTKAIEDFPDYAEAYYQRASLYFLHLNKDDLARTDLEKVLKINPDHVDARNLMKSLRPAAPVAAPPSPKRIEATKMVDQTENLLSVANAAMEKGNLAEMAANIDLAIAQINKAIAVDDSYPRAFHIRGIIYIGQSMMPTNKNPAGSRSLAMTAFNKAIELDPKFVQAYFGRGVVYEQSGDKLKAKAEYEKALQIDPKDKEAEMGLKRVN